MKTSRDWIILFPMEYCYCLKQIGPVTLVEISNHLDVEKPTISRTVNRLAEQQLIEEVPSNDKRERMIQLTKKD
ncbi:MarR family transcriptional regulator [Oceanobacillus sp. 143]|nr:MarR family transcriptional regulator [Oceanobacillus sp. 143]